MKIISVVGARPQFIKLAPLSREIRKHHRELICHTGQHFDPNMSDIFFGQMGIPAPDINLGVCEGSHGEQTGRMLIAVEPVYLEEKPDLVVVFGDTNSTLAGALAASKLQIPVVHVEAGLRSGDMQMPEEQNRIMTDHIATHRCCPCDSAVAQLRSEGVTRNVHNTGDVMFDAFRMFSEQARQLRAGGLLLRDFPDGTFDLLTIHRPSNTDCPEVLAAIMAALQQSGRRILFPAHPRTRKKIEEFGIRTADSIQLTEPLGYLETLLLIGSARRVITDSGGMQKEALFAGTHCVTLRDTTEWSETLTGGWNTLVMKAPGELDASRLLSALAAPAPAGPAPHPYGDGHAAEKIAALLG
ncbi:non-hydrolyzing UDP-N-acetylglucosamine 2-epimerase [Thermodesulfobacteriota bacterium]